MKSPVQIFEQHTAGKKDLNISHAMGIFINILQSLHEDIQELKGKPALVFNPKDVTGMITLRKKDGSLSGVYEGVSKQ